MMPDQVPNRWIKLAHQLLECLLDELPEPVCRAELRHHSAVVPSDDCDCECADGHGQAWVRITHAVIANVDRSRCPPNLWNVTYELGTRRCVATMDEAGTPPSPITTSEEAEELAFDARAQRRVLLCCKATDDRDLTAVSQSPLGPAGGCAGWVTVFTTAMLAL